MNIKRLNVEKWFVYFSIAEAGAYGVEFIAVMLLLAITSTENLHAGLGELSRYRTEPDRSHAFCACFLLRRRSS